jgi:hypothetical protein
MISTANALYIPVSCTVSIWFKLLPLPDGGQLMSFWSAATNDRQIFMNNAGSYILAYIQITRSSSCSPPLPIMTNNGICHGYLVFDIHLSVCGWAPVGIQILPPGAKSFNRNCAKWVLAIMPGVLCHLLRVSISMYINAALIYHRTLSLRSSLFCMRPPDGAESTARMHWCYVKIFLHNGCSPPYMDGQGLTVLLLQFKILRSLTLC